MFIPVDAVLLVFAAVRGVTRLLEVTGRVKISVLRFPLQGLIFSLVRGPVQVLDRTRRLVVFQAQLFWHNTSGGGDEAI
jgi:hypothetical protein